MKTNGATHVNVLARIHGGPRMSLSLRVKRHSYQGWKISAVTDDFALQNNQIPANQPIIQELSAQCFVMAYPQVLTLTLEQPLNLAELNIK